MDDTLSSFKVIHNENYFWAETRSVMSNII